MSSNPTHVVNNYGGGPGIVINGAKLEDILPLIMQTTRGQTIAGGNEDIPDPILQSEPCSESSPSTYVVNNHGGGPGIIMNGMKPEETIRLVIEGTNGGHCPSVNPEDMAGNVCIGDDDADQPCLSSSGNLSSHHPTGDSDSSPSTPAQLMANASMTDNSLTTTTTMADTITENDVFVSNDLAKEAEVAVDKALDSATEHDHNSTPASKFFEEITEINKAPPLPAVPMNCEVADIEGTPTTTDEPSGNIEKGSNPYVERHGAKDEELDTLSVTCETQINNNAKIITYGGQEAETNSVNLANRSGAPTEIDALKQKVAQLEEQKYDFEAKREMLEREVSAARAMSRKNLAKPKKTEDIRKTIASRRLKYLVSQQKKHGSLKSVATQTSSELEKPGGDTSQTTATRELELEKDLHAMRDDNADLEYAKKKLEKELDMVKKEKQIAEQKLTKIKPEHDEWEKQKSQVLAKEQIALCEVKQLKRIIGEHKNETSLLRATIEILKKDKKDLFAKSAPDRASSETGKLSISLPATIPGLTVAPSTAPASLPPTKTVTMNENTPSKSGLSLLTPPLSSSLSAPFLTTQTAKTLGGTLPHINMPLSASEQPVNDAKEDKYSDNKPNASADNSQLNGSPRPVKATGTLQRRGRPKYIKPMSLAQLTEPEPTPEPSPPRATQHSMGLTYAAVLRHSVKD